MDGSGSLIWQEILIVAIAVSLLFCAMSFIYIIGIYCCSYCFCYRKRKTDTLNPLAYLTNMDLMRKNMEENFYLSEILSSSGHSCSSGGSLISLRSDSTVSIISETGSNFELLPIVNSVVSSCAPIHTMAKNIHRSPSITLGFKFMASEGVKCKENGKLIFIIKNVNWLPTKDYPRYAETFITLTILRSSKMFISGNRNEEILYTKRSRSFRSARNVTLNEYFVMEGQYSEMKNWNVRLTAFDHDMYTDPMEIASATTSLSGLYKQATAAAKQADNPKEAEITVALKSAEQILGNLLVGLSYLPTSQRLYVNILRASNLKELSGSKQDLCPYAQLFLLAGITGRQLKKKRLFFEKTTDQYDFNSTVSFDILPSQLDTITLLIVLYNKSRNERNVDHTCPEKMPDDRYLGRVALGNLVTGVKEKKHWRMMASMPRRVVTVWHTVK